MTDTRRYPAASMPKQAVLEEKIEVKMHPALKRAIQTAAGRERDGNAAAWLRALAKDRVKEMGLLKDEDLDAPASPARGRRKDGGR
jgi:hypothetical protein